MAWIPQSPDVSSIPAYRYPVAAATGLLSVAGASEFVTLKFMMIRPIRELRIWNLKGSTQAYHYFKGVTFPQTRKSPKSWTGILNLCGFLLCESGEVGSTRAQFSHGQSNPRPSVQYLEIAGARSFSSEA